MTDIAREARLERALAKLVARGCTGHIRCWAATLDGPCSCGWVALSAQLTELLRDVEVPKQ